MSDIGEMVDGEFDKVMPSHLRGEGVDIQLIANLVAYPNKEISSRLISRMNSQTNTAAIRECELAYKEIFPDGMFGEYKKDVRDGIYRPFVDHHKKNLSELGLPEEKIGTSRILLSALDMGVANLFHHDVDKVEPTGFGPYAMIGYPIRQGIRYFMLEGAQK